MFLSAHEPPGVHVCLSSCPSVLFRFYSYFTPVCSGDCVDNTERTKPRKRTNSELLISFLCQTAVFPNRGFSSRHASTQLMPPLSRSQADRGATAQRKKPLVKDRDGRTSQVTSRVLSQRNCQIFFPPDLLVHLKVY